MPAIMTDDQHAAWNLLDTLDISVQAVDTTMVGGRFVEVPGFGFSVSSEGPLTEEQWALVRRCVLRPFEPRATREENGRLTQWFKFTA